MTRLARYKDMAELFYPRYQKRQLALFDFSYYAVVGRPWWVANEFADGKADYIKFLLYFINLLCIQEHLASTNQRFRVKLLRHMEDAGLKDFFQDSVDRAAYKHCKKNKRFIKANRKDPDYVVVDGLLPKSIGNVIEMIVYVTLLQSELGFPVLLQLQQRLMMKKAKIVAPDLILIRRDGKVFGIEIGHGTGQFSLRDSKIRQMNEFVSETKLPLLTAIVTLPFRCPACNQWILFCDQVIEEFALSKVAGGGRCRECVTCPRFNDGKCADIIYYGRLRKGGQKLRYHLRCVKKSRYVKRVIAGTNRGNDPLLSYYPHFHGLEGLTQNA
jgi:hypothetical protein